MAHESLSASIVSVLSRLKAKRRLERDRGLVDFKSLLQSEPLSSSELEDVERSLASSLTSSDSSWEELHGAIMAVSVLVCEKKAREEFLVGVRTSLPDLLDHEESRVRNATGRRK